MPFAGAAAVAWIAVLVGSRITWSQYFVATGLALAAGALTLQTLRGRVAHGVVPSVLLFLAAVGLLRNASGGIASGAGTLAVIPVLQVALYSRSRTDLAWVLAAVGLLYVVPILVVGGGAYPPTQYRTALLTLTVSGIIGWATQGLVASARARAGEARARERMLEQVSATVHNLFDSSNVRGDVCEAARRISGGTVALLYEPGADGGRLRCTGVVGLGPHGHGLDADRSGDVEAVYRSGQPELVDSGIEARARDSEQWVAAGRPTSVLYQPLLRDGEVLGVLVVGWPDQIQADGPRTTVAALLAHEAAAVIARADVLGDLADAAQTDALTGLPNRRAWDLELAEALREHPRLAIAILDLDHFKQYNDTYGHPAGDRLLKETAAAWRDQLRAGDLLARLGGEEFGLLLPDCDGEVALDVVERLRGSVSGGRTCSAGIAVRAVGEDAEVVVARADGALYRAKASGRDQTLLSGAGVP